MSFLRVWSLHLNQMQSDDLIVKVGWVPASGHNWQP